MSIDVLVVVVAYGANEDLRLALTQVQDLPVVVVDNRGDKATAEMASSLGARYLAATDNLGFAGGVNLALLQAWDGVSDVLLLNPDAAIGSFAVRELQSALHADGTLAAVGPRLISPDGRPQRAQWPMPGPAQAWCEALGIGRYWRGAHFVTGAVLLIRATAIRALGGLDDRFFLYAEEADWQRRAISAGWRVAVVHQVTAQHVGGGTSRDALRRERLFDRSTYLFARKWYRGGALAMMIAGIVTAAVRRSVVGSREHRERNRRLLRSWLGGTPLRSAQRPHARSIVHVVQTDAFAGVERYVVDTANEQVRRGHRVVVVGGDPLAMRHGLVPAVAHLPGATFLQALRSVRSAGRFDIAHAHMTAAELVCAIAKRSLGGSLVSTRHFAAVRGKTRGGTLTRGFIARQVDLQIAISRFVADHVDGPSTVLHNGVPEAASDEPVPREKVVLMAQRLEPEKDTRIGLDAWALSKLAAQGWRLIVFGRGAERADLETHAGQLGVTHSVTFAGFSGQMRTELRRAGVLLATAPAEPFGLTVVEAMAEGLPVVAADGGAHRETVGDAGVLFPARDAAACADGLREICSNDARRSGLAALARRRQRELFTIKGHVDGLEHAYERAGARTRHPTGRG